MENTPSSSTHQQILEYWHRSVSDVLPDANAGEVWAVCSQVIQDVGLLDNADGTAVIHRLAIALGWIREGIPLSKIAEMLREYDVWPPKKPTAKARIAVVPGYEPLSRVLSQAYLQSAKGKGKERHSNGDTPFDEQPIMEIGRMLSSTCDGQLYQVIKKTQESSRMVSRGETGAAKAELLGAIVYAAAAYLLIEESEE